MVAVAVNVTGVPGQTGLAEAAIHILTGRMGFTVMVKAFDVAGLPDGQVAFEVNSQVTMSLLAGVYVKVVLLVPVLFPLTFH